jgi:hypothetical protein
LERYLVLQPFTQPLNCFQPLIQPLKELSNLR